jgi:DNA-binding beta-propeller fold protein YncE
MQRLLPLLLLALLVAACDSVDPVTPDPEPQTTGFLVAAEGAFGQDTGGLTRFNPDGTVAARYPAGDGLYVQSAALHGGRVFAATGASVDVLDGATLTRSARLPVPNPRYLAFDGSTAFVTSLYTDAQTFGAGAVTRLTVPASGQASAGSPVVIGGNPEGLALAGGRLYVANHDFGGGSTLTVLNPSTLAEVAPRIEVCEGPRFVFADAQGEVVVVCEGSGFGDGATHGAFVVLNGATGAEVARVNLPTPIRAAGAGQSASFSAERQEVHAVHSATGRVYRFDTHTNTLAATLEIGGAPIGAVAYDAARGYLVLGRHAAGNPYTAQGILTVHTRDGALVDTFHGAGIAPVHVTVITETPE